MSPLEQLLAPDWPYAIAYAVAATRSLPLPAAPPVLHTSARADGWTAAEDTIVRERYAAHRETQTVHLLAAELGRTSIAVQTRAKKLGVTLPRSKNAGGSAWAR